MGRPKTCNPCCGSGGVGSSSSSSRSGFTGSLAPVPCSVCIDNVAPAQWAVSVSGLSGGTICSTAYCTKFNRDWLLTQTAACTWNETRTDGASCFGTLYSIDVSIISTRIQLRMERSGNTFATYRKTITAPIDCLTSHTLTLFSSNPDCSGLPGSLTISPA